MPTETHTQNKPECFSVFPWSLARGLTPVQQTVLAHLWKYGKQRPSLHDFARGCGTTKQIVRDTVAYLVKHHIINPLVSDTIYMGSPSLEPSSPLYVSYNILNNKSAPAREHTREGTHTLARGSLHLAGTTAEMEVVARYNSVAKKIGLRNSRPGEQTIRRIRTRLKEYPPTDPFWERLWTKLEKSKHLANESWFDLAWMMHDEEHLRKVADGWMDWRMKMPVSNRLSANKAGTVIDRLKSRRETV